MHANDTIAAIATPAGRGGVGVIRISGGEAAGVANRMTGLRPHPRHAHFARFRDGDGAVLDEGLLLFFPAPHSYTGEDVVELHAHGSPVVLDLMMRRITQLGVRLAGPGEFSRRAFCNGKRDLAQTEAVADLIASAAAQAARSAQRVLQGEFSSRIETLRGDIVALRAQIESALDFSDDGGDSGELAGMRDKLGAIREQIAALRKRGRQGALLTTGAEIAIVGRPNVGKSSLLNRLAQRDEAIVSDIPGTTRDTLKCDLLVRGIPVRVIDTAGLRPSADAIEAEGIRRARAAMRKADLVLLVRDVPCDVSGDISPGVADGASGEGEGDDSDGLGGSVSGEGGEGDGDDSDGRGGSVSSGGDDDGRCGSVNDGEGDGDDSDGRGGSVSSGGGDDGRGGSVNDGEGDGDDSDGRGGSVSSEGGEGGRCSSVSSGGGDDGRRGDVGNRLAQEDGQVWLRDLNDGDIPCLVVLNKIDLAGDGGASGGCGVHTAGTARGGGDADSADGVGGAGGAGDVGASGTGSKDDPGSGGEGGASGTGGTNDRGDRGDRDGSGNGSGVSMKGTGTDEASAAMARPAKMAEDEVVSVSAKTGEGLDALTARIAQCLGYDETADDALGARRRHLTALTVADDALKTAAHHLDDGAIELFAEELRVAGDALGGIVGATTTEDLLGEIFARFCIGK